MQQRSTATAQPVERSRPNVANDVDTDARRVAYTRAVAHLRRVQQQKGALAGEVVWNPMLVSQWVIMCYLLDRPIDPARRRRIHRNLEVQVMADGGWGMHPRSGSWLFHTTLGYVALRLLDYDDDDPLVAGALGWIHQHAPEGVHALPTWGRLWLAMLGLYPWSGLQPILPEMWLLPDAAPMHPRRLYCHMRLIYLGVSYLYGKRFVGKSPDRDPRLAQLRDALYPAGFDLARFERLGDEIAQTDLFEAPRPELRAAFKVLKFLERWQPELLRQRALERALEHIEFEFDSTGGVCLSPVNGMLFALGLHATRPDHPRLDEAVAGIEYWMWEDEDEGLRICGARSDIWDTAFVLQSLAEGPDVEPVRELVRDAATWLQSAQMRADVPNGAAHYRAPARGGWGFADENHPWPVSDCTAEALEALMKVESRFGLRTLELDRKIAAIEFILQRQCDDGGFGSYESRRGSMVLKQFNPAEIYGNCMLEYSYTECTASCLRALSYAARELGADLPADTRRALSSAAQRAVRFLLDAQRDDGSWPGFWGVDRTYGTYFAVGGLLASGLSPEHPRIRRACSWLCRHQRDDGGWGESFEALLSGDYTELAADEPSSVVQTAWAVACLQSVSPERHAEVIDAGLDYLVSRQSDDGSWPSEPATGVFFNTAVLEYRLYRQVFPTWALARALGEG